MEHRRYSSPGSLVFVNIVFASALLGATGHGPASFGPRAIASVKKEDQEGTPAPTPSSTPEPFPFGTGFIPASSSEIERIGIADAPLFAAVNLPPSVSLKTDFPLPDAHGQGRQMSCVAWASSYALRSYEERLRRHWDLADQDHLFSPAFIYNAINNHQDNGAQITDALQRLYNVGDVPLSLMPWSETDLSTPRPSLNTAAGAFKISLYKPVQVSLNSIKTYLYKRIPVIVGFYVDDSFGYPMMHNTWPWEQLQDLSHPGYRHAVVLVGYDDGKKLRSGGQGAFEFINSYGSGWGSNGYGWMSYATFSKQIIQAFIVGVNMSGYGSAEASLAGDSLARSVTFSLDPNIHYDLYYSEYGNVEEIFGTIQAPANAVGDVQVVVRVYFEGADHNAGNPVRATDFPDMKTPDGYLAVSSGSFTIPSEGLVNKSWYVLVPAASIQVNHAPGQPPQLYHFVAVPELYIDDIQLAIGTPIRFRLYL